MKNNLKSNCYHTSKHVSLLFIEANANTNLEPINFFKKNKVIYFEILFNSALMEYF
jgi:hypothetical protein